VLPLRPAVDTLVLDPHDPLAVARRLIADHYSVGGYPLLRSWRGDLYAYTGTHYRVLDEASARAEQYRFMEPAVRTTKKGLAPFKPTATVVNNVMDALRGATHLDRDVVAPAWLDLRLGPPAAELIACDNGLLHFPTRVLRDHAPEFFTTYALPFAFDANAPEPVEWLTFLHSLWPDDEDAIRTLQEVFGYIVSGDMRQQKLFLIVGPPRAGKDTIARILRSLIGDANWAGPTLSSLAGPFGLQPLIGKPLAIIGDARMSTRVDQTIIGERLLSITGQSAQGVDRKHRDTWNGVLPTRFLILTNELPRLEDASGALASRFIVLTLSRSWLGREDTELFSRLEGELSGILSWALDGLERLWDRGRFSTPRSSHSAIREMEDLGSPIKAFVRDCCIVEPGASEETDDLYGAWAQWCRAHGRSHVPAEAVFGRDLRAATLGVQRKQRETSENGARVRWAVYDGIRLTERPKSSWRDND
jgi:putative DNA primase/helicase